MFGHMTDVGGKVPGSLPTDATQIFEEGLNYLLQKYTKMMITRRDSQYHLHNCRLPIWNKSDFNAIVASNKNC